MVRPKNFNLAVLAVQHCFRSFSKPIRITSEWSQVSPVIYRVRTFSSESFKSASSQPRLISSTTDRKFRRFYESVSVENQSSQNSVNDLWCVCLDGRLLTTPGQNCFVLPNKTTALLVASEWDHQDEFIKLELMPLTNISIQILDLISHGDTRMLVEAQVVKYLESDSALFRTGNLQTEEQDGTSRNEGHQVELLATKQAELLDPILRQIEKHYGLEQELKTSNSLVPPQQHQRDLDRLASIVKKKTEWELGCLFTVVRNLKSYLLGISLLDGLISVDRACQVANLEESHQRERWGEVEGYHDVEIATIQMWLNAALLLLTAVG